MRPFVMFFIAQSQELLCTEILLSPVGEAQGRLWAAHPGAAHVVRAAQMTTACRTALGLQKNIQDGMSVLEHLMIPFLPLGAAQDPQDLF